MTRFDLKFSDLQLEEGSPLHVITRSRSTLHAETLQLSNVATPATGIEDISVQCSMASKPPPWTRAGHLWISVPAQAVA
jgi:hypothetical protein